MPVAPPIAGELTVDGVTAPVVVVRDRWGVPHIAAGNTADLFFAQGFVQAQDRLFQMDLWRRSVQGRLAAVLGSNFFVRDAMTRRMQYRGDIEREWASYGADARSIADAFTRGINAWVEQTRTALPEEFVTAGWQPETWDPADLLNRTDAFAGSGNARDELFAHQLVAALGPASARRLLPELPAGRSTLPDGVDPDIVSRIVSEAIGRVGPEPFFSGLAGPVVGSNAWAIAPSRSKTGAALLAADPHRPLQVPAAHYLVHLQAPGWNVIGATVPWLPGVSIGHNDHVAWGWTAVPADTQDIIVERVNPAEPTEVLHRARWTATSIDRGTVEVKGRAEPLGFDRRETPRGVVVAVDSERHIAYAVAWRGFEPGAASEVGGLAFLRTRSWTEFRDALRAWKMPSAEFVYADVDGHVARQVAGFAPSSPDIDPSSGYVASANRSAPRIRRIQEVLAGRGPFDVAAMAELQQDVLSWNAQQLVPLLDDVQSERAVAESARVRLRAWDRRLAPGSADASLYLAWERALLARLIAGRVPQRLADGFRVRAASWLVAALARPSDAWFGAAPARARDRLLLDALGDAVTAMAPNAGHTLSLVHPLGVTERARERFNVGPFTLPGNADTVMSVSPTAGGRAVGPAFRVVMDLSDWDRSVAILAPGQSGSPASPHYRDLAGTWSRGEYVPLVFTERAVTEHAMNRLILRPRRP